MSEELQLRVDRVNRVFEGDIQSRDTDSIEERQEYYRKNRLAYKLLTSFAGNMHMGLSQDGKFSFDDVWAQAGIVDEYIDQENPDIIVEIASGQAATLKRLSARNSDKTFVGIDLGNGSRKVPKYDPRIVSLIGGDFEALPIKDSSVDVAYSIESICYTENPNDVVAEITRILRPGGIFINFDGYATKPIEQMTELEREAAEIIYKGMMVTTQNNDFTTFEQAIRDNQLYMERQEDLSDQILPTVKHLGRIASLFFRFPEIARKTRRFIPDMVSANAASGYLMPQTIASGLHSYQLTVSRKL